MTAVETVPSLAMILVAAFATLPALVPVEGCAPGRVDGSWLRWFLRHDSSLRRNDTGITKRALLAAVTALFKLPTRHA